MAGTSGQKYDQSRPSQPITAYDLSPNIRAGKYMSLGVNPATAFPQNRPINEQPLILNYGTQTAPSSFPTLPAAADVADTLRVMNFSGAFGQAGIQQYQTTVNNLAPLIHATKGIEIGLQQLAGSKTEYVPGGNRATNPLSYLAGTDPGVFIRATLEFGTANGIDMLFVGYRIQAAYVVFANGSLYNAAVPPYTDLVGIGFAAAVALPNPLRAITALGGAGCVTSSLGFTVASGDVHTLEVRIKGRAASFFINGVRAGDTVKKDGLGAAITGQATTPPPVYNVASALRMIPCILLRQDTALSALYLRNLVVGQLGEDGLAPEQNIANRTA